MKHLSIFIFAVFLGCAGAPGQPSPETSSPASAFGSAQAEIDYLWGMMYEKDAIIEALKGELLAYQGDYGLTHTVNRGENLWSISKAVLDDPYLWIMLYSLNQFTIIDPNLIYPGQILVLP